MKLESARARNTRSFQQGFTLIELMVALVLGLVVVAAVLQFFSGTRQTYTANEGMARAQETGRFAIETMKPAIRSAGLGGICGGSPRLRNHLNLSNAEAQALLAPGDVIRGWEYNNTGIGQPVELDNPQPGDGPASSWVGGTGGGSLGAIPAAIAARALPSSDVLVVREMRPVRGITATSTNAPNQTSLNVNYLTGADTVQQCEIILATNCNRADLFQNTANDGAANLNKGTSGCTPGNVSPGENWSATYGSGAQFYRAESTAFFVGMSDNDMPTLIRARYIQGLAPQFEELVEGIENMQVLYGYSEPGAPDGVGDGQSVNVYLTANNVPNWEYVIAVRIGLLARSPGNIGAGTQSQTFDVALTEVSNAADGLLRQPYNTTLALRNRQIVR